MDKLTWLADEIRPRQLRGACRLPYLLHLKERQLEVAVATSEQA